MIALGFTAVSISGIHKKSFWSGSYDPRTHGLGTTIIIWNKEVKDVIKIVKLLEEFVLLIKSASATIENGVKKQNGGFPGMLLGTLGANSLGNLLAYKGTATTIGVKKWTKSNNSFWGNN